VTHDELLGRAERARDGGDLVQAERLYRHALAKTRSQSVLYGLGTLLHAMGRAPEAQVLLQESAGIGDSVAVTTALLLCLADLGDWQEARAAAGMLVRLRCGSTDEWMFAGRALVRLKMYGLAAAAIEKALLQGGPAYLPLYGLGYALHMQGAWHSALEAYRRALALSPGEDVGLLTNMATCEQRLHHYASAAETLARALRAEPTSLLTLSKLVEVSAMRCAFDDERRYAEQLASRSGSLTVDSAIAPFLTLFAPLPEGVRRQVLDLAAARAGSGAGTPLKAKRSAAGPERRLRIGYVSSDICDHAVGRLFAGYVGAHDRKRVHVHAYSLRHSGDAVARRVAGEVETLRDLDGVSTVEIAETIRADGIDVLIDLNGFTHGGRPELMASRPAAVQISYLGFIHDHRAPWLDHVVMDRAVAPAGQRSAYLNSVIDIPGTMFPPASSDGCEAAAWSRVEIGIEKDAFLMCVSANAYKIDRRVLRCWVEIAKRVKNGIVMLYADRDAAASLEKEWRALGGARSNLVVVPRASRQAYLAQLRGCDLMLDTFRYGGGASSVDAIMQGLPLLTLPGHDPVSRMGASLNAFIGMDSLIARDDVDYVLRAAALAEHREAVRAEVISAVSNSGFLDGTRIAVALERSAFDLLS